MGYFRWSFAVESSMPETDARSLDHATLEQMRRAGVRLVRAGVAPFLVAEGLGVSVQAVYRWVKLYRAGGEAALAAKPVPGRVPMVTPEVEQRLYDVIVGKDPRQYRFDFGLWTRDLVRQVLESEFGIILSVKSVGRVLRKMGLSPQRPLWRAWQANPEAVRAWKEEVFPAIRAQAKAAGATVYFADEAGIRSDYHGGTTWAPVGRTPIVKATGARHRVNMLSAVSAQGKLRFSVVEGTVDSATFVEFCKKLVDDSDGPVYLIVDGHSTHKSKITREYVESTQGALTLFFLPPYSPQLNPDEWVWKNVKVRHEAPPIRAG